MRYRDSFQALLTTLSAFVPVLGTLAGVIMSLILTACFAQTPEVFILALSIWIGPCLTAATMLRNFQAYGAMLAGLTTAARRIVESADGDEALPAERRSLVIRCASTLRGMAILVRDLALPAPDSPPSAKGAVA
jgi:uncharacterized membrane protein YccC